MHNGEIDTIKICFFTKWPEEDDDGEKKWPKEVLKLIVNNEETLSKVTTIALLPREGLMWGDEDWDGKEDWMAEGMDNKDIMVDVIQLSMNPTNSWDATSIGTMFKILLGIDLIGEPVYGEEGYEYGVEKFSRLFHCLIEVICRNVRQDEDQRRRMIYDHGKLLVDELSKNNPDFNTTSLRDIMLQHYAISYYRVKNKLYSEITE